MAVAKVQTGAKARVRRKITADLSCNYSDLAPREKGAIDFIDSFIDSQQAVQGSDYLVPLPFVEMSIQIHASKEIQDYISNIAKHFSTFVKLRTHLWKISKNSDGTFVMSKQSSEFRSMLHYICNYIEGLCQTWGCLGASLNDISSVINEHYRSAKYEIGSGYEALKKFLLNFPLLFEMITYDSRLLSLQDVLFRNQATLVGDVILLPPYLEGEGTVDCYMNDKACGFIRDASSGDSAYFPLVAVHPPSVAKGQRFRFEAVLSSRYLDGSSANEWRIFRMWPSQRSNDRFSVISTRVLDPGPSNAKAPEAVNDEHSEDSEGPHRPMNAKPASLASEKTRIKTTVSDVDEPVQAWNQQPAAVRCRHDSEIGTQIENDIGPSRDRVSKNFQVLPNFEGAAFKERKATDSGDLSIFDDSAEFRACTTASEPESKLSFSFADIAQSILDFPAQSTVESSGSDPVCSSATKHNECLTISAIQRNPKSGMVHNCETKEAECQTDFRDDRELLLRLLRNSDILRLIRAMRVPNQ